MDLERLACFPLWPVVDGKCGCGNEECESSPGKHPIYRWKGLGIAEKMKGPAGCGYGIATGTRSGLFVVDLDGEEAMQWWADRCAEHDIDPWTTYSVNTARGCHLYFALPDRPVSSSQSVLAPKVDVRGEGGYVVAVGSVHKSGYVYNEEDPNAEVEEAPAWLLACPGLYGTTRVVGEAGENAPIPVDVDTPLGQSRVKAGQALCATMPASVQGQNGSGALWDVALKLVRGLELPLDVCADLINGIYNPRCDPEWSEEHILHKLEGARDQSDIPCGPEKSDEEHAALVLRMVARAKNLRPGYVPTRKVPNPNHFYTFTPGKDTSDMSHEPQAALPVDIANMLATHPDWDGVLQFDTFRQRISAVDPPMRMHAEHGGKLSDRDIAHIRMWLSCHGKLLKKEDANDVVFAAAERNQFDPVVEYLESCRDARIPGILDTMAAEVFGVTDEMSQEFVKKTLVAAVRRVLNPGTRVDTVLVLVGEQGARKTTFVQTLFGIEFVKSQMPDLDNKDASIGLQDFWAIELGEIYKILKADKDTVKEFLSRAYDDFIPRYGRLEVRVPRHTIFIGTTNEERFLSDATGNRRYWPILVQRVALDWVARNRDAIWGEALALAEDPTFEHWFRDEKLVAIAQQQFITTDPWHEAVADYLKGKSRVKPSDVFVHGLEGEIKDFDRSKQMRVADTLKRLGCTQVKSHGKMVYDVPDAIAKDVVPETGTEKLKRRFEQ